MATHFIDNSHIICNSLPRMSDIRSKPPHLNRRRTANKAADDSSGRSANEPLRVALQLYKESL